MTLPSLCRDRHGELCPIPSIPPSLRDIGMKVLKIGTLIFAGTTAVITLPLLGLWLLGIPGVENAYAIGWGLGLKTLWHYLLVCLFTVVGSLLMMGLQRQLAGLRYGQVAIAGFFWIFFGYSVVNLYRAFQIMGVLP